MYTFQDFASEPDKRSFVVKAISEHVSSPVYKLARTADNYDRQRNETINNYVRTIFQLTGSPVEDFTASNNKIASNFFNRLNTQRCTYSLGNGISFTKKREVVGVDGIKVTTDVTKEKLGRKFDTDLKNAGYYALIHGVSFCFWNVDRMYTFPVTEFVPLWDEENGELRAGIRFWRLNPDKPLVAVLYEEDGYTKYRAKDASDLTLQVVTPKKAYKTNIKYTPATGESAVIGTENYGRLPIVPFWGNRLHQSTLIGMRQAIDSFDLIRSGFANDLTDCSQIYWIIDNCGGMSDGELAQFRDRLKINHIALNDADGGSKVTPYTQDIPYQARKQYLDDIRAGIYEDFGGLDVHTVAAGATNDHIDAAYQPLDENADDYEYQIIECVQQILALQGIEDTPVFKRNRISNHKEQVDIVIAEAPYLDDETLLSKLPNITPDEIQQILSRKDAQDQSRFDKSSTDGTEEDTDEAEEANMTGGEG